MVRPMYLLVAGIIISGLGKGKAARAIFESLGTLIVILGIIDMVIGQGWH